MSVEPITCYGILRFSHVCYDSRIAYTKRQYKEVEIEREREKKVKIIRQHTARYRDRVRCVYRWLFHALCVVLCCWWFLLWLFLSPSLSLSAPLSCICIVKFHKRFRIGYRFSRLRYTRTLISHSFRVLVLLAVGCCGYVKNADAVHRHKAQHVFYSENYAQEQIWSRRWERRRRSWNKYSYTRWKIKTEIEMPLRTHAKKFSQTLAAVETNRLG